MELNVSIYEHAAAVIGERPWTVSRDPELLYKAQAEAFRLYANRPMVVGIDIYNLEAEAYGAIIEDPGGNGTPAITRPCCSLPLDILKLPHFDPRTAGRIPKIIKIAGRLAAAFPEADVRVPLSGPFSIASNLMGFEDLLMSVASEPAQTLSALQHLAGGQVAFCEEIIAHNLDIAFFESAAAPPLLSPELFRAVELPALKRLLGLAAEQVKHAVPCIIGGDTFPVLDAILETGTGYVICPVETDQAAFMNAMLAYPDVMVRINMNSGILTCRDWKVIRAEVDRVLKLAQGRPKVCLGTGALPYETPPENIRLIKQYLNPQTGKG